MDIFLDYYSYLFIYMKYMDDHYESISNNNHKYNNHTFQLINLHPEIINLILINLPLNSLIQTALACKSFLSNAINIIKKGNIYITLYSDFIKLFYEQPKSMLMKLIHENINILYYDNSKNYVESLPKNNSVNIFLNLKKIVLYVNFVDQLNVLKIIKKINIVIHVCYNNKCSVCLMNEICDEMEKSNKPYKLYHNKKLYR